MVYVVKADINVPTTTTVFKLRTFKVINGFQKGVLSKRFLN